MKANTTINSNVVAILSYPMVCIFGMIINALLTLLLSKILPSTIILIWYVSTVFVVPPLVVGVIAKKHPGMFAFVGAAVTYLLLFLVVMPFAAQSFRTYGVNMPTTIESMLLAPTIKNMLILALTITTLSLIAVPFGILGGRLKKP